MAPKGKKRKTKRNGAAIKFAPIFDENKQEVQWNQLEKLRVSSRVFVCF